MPNYPAMEIAANYKGKWYVKEIMDGMTIHRVWLYVSKNKNIVSRLLNYFSFVITSFITGSIKPGKPDYIWCESPPLFLGIAAMLLKKIKRTKLIFNVSDLWPESAEKLGLVTNRFLLNMSRRLEEKIYTSSFLITGQTMGIVNNIKVRFPEKKVSWIPNGADFERYSSDTITYDWRKENGFSDRDFLILYAGIIGHAQGLSIVMNAAQKTKENVLLKWILLGAGPEKETLLSMKSQTNAVNVFFPDPLPKARMRGIICACDAALIPLRKIELFKGAIPSKIFEALLFKKPLLLGVDGEARTLFIDEAKAGLFYIPEDAGDLADKANYLFSHRQEAIQMGERGFHYVSAKFDRKKIADDFYTMLTA